MKAKDDKCCVCGQPAVAYYPCVDPDIQSYPYCAKHLEQAMIDMAKVVFKNDKGMQFLAIYAAKNAVKKYKQKENNNEKENSTKI